MAMSKKDYITVVDGLVSAYGIMLESADFGHREVLADTVRETAAVLACRFGADNPRFNAGYFHARLDQGLEAEVEEFLAKSSERDDYGHQFTDRGPNGVYESDHCFRCYAEKYEGRYYAGCAVL